MWTDVTSALAIPVVLLYALLLGLAGRCLVAWGKDQDYPLALSIYAGLGLVTICFAVCAYLQLSPLIAVFMLGVVAMVLVFLLHRSIRAVEHLWLGPFLAALVLFPLWNLLRFDEPETTYELINIYPTVIRFLLGDWPTEGWLRLALLQSPLMVVGDKFLPQVLVLWHLLLVPLAAQSLAVGAGMRLKWSNLPWVLGGMLLGVTVFNPFFTPRLITVADPIWTQGVALFLLAMPLMRQQPLPHGVSAVPFALTATILAVSEPLFWPVLMTMGGVWLLRTVLLEEHRTLAVTWLGLIILTALPVAAVLLWQLTIPTTHAPMQLAAPLYGETRIMLLAALVVLIFAGLGERLTQIHHARTRREGMVILLPWLVPLVLLSAIIGAGAPLDVSFALLQLVLVFPFWTLWQRLYSRTILQKWSFTSPWGMGGLLIAVLIGLQYSTLPLWKGESSAYVTHAQDVMGNVRLSRWWQPEQSIVVWAKPESYAAMVYEMGGPEKVVDATPWVAEANGNREKLHALLKSQGWDMLWVDISAQEGWEVFRREFTPDHSYLFTLTDTSFVLLNKFPHLSYQN